LAQRYVAGVAKNATHMTRVVIVVDVKTPAVSWFAAYGTASALSKQHGVIIILRYAVLVLQFSSATVNRLLVAVGLIPKFLLLTGASFAVAGQAVRSLVGLVEIFRG